jgi:hypothetical protein
MGAPSANKWKYKQCSTTNDSNHRKNRKETLIERDSQVGDNSSSWLNRVHRKNVINGYASWIKEMVDNGWDPYLLTIEFNQLPGSQHIRLRQMTKDIELICSRLATEAVRKPTSPKWAKLLPRGFFVPDLPVYKNDKQGTTDAIVNNGLHFHGVLAVSPRTRLKCTLDEHFADRIDTYVGATEAVRTINVRPITHNTGFTVDYAVKAVKNGRFANDDIIILPRALSEL